MNEEILTGYHKNVKHQDADEFTTEAQHFTEFGRYTNHPFNTSPKSKYYKYWIEQSRRCIRGYNIGRDWIPGYYYHFLNFCPILKTKDIDGDMLGPMDMMSPMDDPSSDLLAMSAADRVEGFPDFWDGHYKLYHYYNDSELRGEHSAVIKTRTRGFSFVGCGMMNRNFHLLPATKSYAFADDKEYLTEEGILSKAWEVMDFHAENTAWGKRRTKKNTDMHRKASYIITLNGLQVEKGFRSEIIGVSLHNNYNKARGKRGKLILFEECHSKGTKIFMYDGTFRNIEDIVSGDQVMGVDSKPRNVLKTTEGIGKMYNVKQTKGIDYKVTGNHLLHVCIRKHSNSYEGFRDEYRYMTPEQILGSNNYIKKQIRGIKSSGIEFDERKLEIDPYFMGLWLGDGSARQVNVTTMDDEIRNYLYDVAKENDLKVRVESKPDNKAQTYCLSNGREWSGNNLLKALQYYGVHNNKHIHDDFIYNSKENRLKFLAGLIDSDGSLYNKGQNYVIATKDKSIAEKIAFISRTLGYRPQINKNYRFRSGKKYLCYRVHISGNDLSEIPVLIQRKKAKAWTSNHNPLFTRIKIIPDKEEQYYGITLDGDNLYMLEDLTITHNSGKNPHLLKAWNIALRSVAIGRKSFGLMIAFGCVCKGTKVWTNEGRLVNIEDLQQKDGIVGYDGYDAYKEEIKWFKPPAKKPCYRITTSGGEYIECSEDHPLMWTKPKWYKSKDGQAQTGRRVTFTLAKDIKVGDQLLKIDAIPIFGKKKIKDARMLGLLIGDGNYTKGATPQLSCAEDEVFRFAKKNYDITEYKTFIKKYGGIFSSVGIKGFQQVLRDAGIYGQVKDKKRLPNNIHEYDKKSLANLLGGYFDADGHVTWYKKRKTVKIVLTSNVKELLEEMKNQLLKFGIHGKITKEKRTGGYKGGKKYVYRLYITNVNDVKNFYENIKLLSKEKIRVLKRIYESKAIDRSRIDKGAFQLNPDNDKGHFFIGKEGMRNIRTETVSRIEFIGDKDIYNMHTGHTNTYVSNNFITKQTGGTENADFMGLEQLFYEGGGYRVRMVPNEWDPGAHDQKCGFFFSSAQNYSGDDKKEETTCMDENGNSDWQKATNIVLTEREKIKKETKNPEAIIRHIAEEPLNPQEAVLRVSGSLFPTNDLKQQLAHIRTHPSRYEATEYIGDLVVNESGKVEWIPDQDAKPIKQYPHNNLEDTEGCIVIYEHPVPDKTGVIPYGVYIAGSDNYDHDQSTTQSLGSTFIMNRLTERIVAEYTGRPLTAPMYYEKERRLLLYYNCLCNYENNLKGLHGYFDKMHCTWLLCDTPPIIIDKLDDKSLMARGKGTPGTTPLKTWGCELILTWLLTPVAPDSEVLNLHKIRSEALLQELVYHSKDGNFDRVDALIYLLIYKEQLSNFVTRFDRKANEVDPFFAEHPLFKENIKPELPDPFEDIKIKSGPAPKEPESILDHIPKSPYQ